MSEERLKDPNSDEPYGHDWSDWLDELTEVTGVTQIIVDSQWSITGPDAVLTTHNAAIVANGRKTQVYFAGGTKLKRYAAVNHITTNTGVTDDKTLYIVVRDR